MKKIIAAVFAAALMLAGTNAFAQISVGAGYINSNLSGQYNGNKIDPQNTNGFYVGGSYNVGVASGLSVAPGVYFSMLAKVTEDGASLNLGGLGTIAQNAKSTFTEMAVNVPVMANYAYELTRDAKVFAFAGPTFQFGLSSQVKTDNSGVLSNTNITNYYDSDSPYYNRFNIYVGGGIGAQFGKIIVNVGYNYGLMNLYAGSTDNTNYHRANLTIGVSYAL